MADIHQPHDRLFRAVFSDADEAASLLQAALPDTIRLSFDWTTLTLVEGTFVDKDLHESQSDLLYQVEYTGTGQPVSMYVLFEHQSSPDPWLRLRLLRYCCRIWEADRRDVNGAERSPIFGALRDSNPGGYPEAALLSSSFTGALSMPALRLLLSR